MERASNKATPPPSRGSKVAVISVLYMTAVLIFLSGACFGVYSAMNGISFKVLNTTVPGIIFGLLVAYLGLRYFISVKKLSADLFDPTSVFSWSNFQRNKRLKKR